jgi:hypothetical protein
MRSMMDYIMAVPHLFEPIDTPVWMQQLFLAGIAVYFTDRWADKIPGVKGKWNWIAQVLTLISIATAMTMLLETSVLGSLSQELSKVAERLATGWSLTWNIGGALVTGAACFLLGRWYMQTEKIFWQGIFFGLGVLTLAILVPVVADVLEFWRFSLVTGIQNLFVIVADSIAKLKIVSS